MVKKTNQRRDKTTLYQDSNNKWRWRRTAPNGEIVGASTQGYANKMIAKKCNKKWM